MFHELDTVVLAHDLPDIRLEKGDIGAVVHVYGDGALEVEFVSGAGATVAVETLQAFDVRAFGEGDILHARPLAA